MQSAATLTEALENWPQSPSNGPISGLGLPDGSGRERLLEAVRRERDARESVP